MDLMNLANPVRTLQPYTKGGSRDAQDHIQNKLQEVLSEIPQDRKFLIVSYSTDVLMAPNESEVSRRHELGYVHVFVLLHKLLLRLL